MCVNVIDCADGEFGVRVGAESGRGGRVMRGRARFVCYQMWGPEPATPAERRRKRPRPPPRAGPSLPAPAKGTGRVQQRLPSRRVRPAPAPDPRARLRACRARYPEITAPSRARRPPLFRHNRVAKPHRLAVPGPCRARAGPPAVS